MNWIKKLFKKELTIEEKETEIYNDENSSDYDRYNSSVKVATHYWNENGIVIPVEDVSLLDCGDITGTITLLSNYENGMRGYLINDETFNKLLNRKFPEHRQIERDRKLKDLGI